MTIIVSCDRQGNIVKHFLSDILSQTVSLDQISFDEAHKSKSNTIFVFREKEDQPTKLIFPNGGTGTSLYLYDTFSFSKLIHQKIDSDKLLFIKYDNTDMNRKPFLNLSNLPDGNYFIQMTGCELGGIYKLKLISKTSLTNK